MSITQRLYEARTDAAGGMLAHVAAASDLQARALADELAREWRVASASVSVRSIGVVLVHTLAVSDEETVRWKRRAEAAERQLVDMTRERNRLRGESGLLVEAAFDADVRAEQAESRQRKCERCDELRACGRYCTRHHQEICVPQLPHLSGKAVR